MPLSPSFERPADHVEPGARANRLATFGTLPGMDAPAVLSPQQLHASRAVTLDWASAGGAPGDSVGERGAADEALASVRAEGLEPSAYVQGLLSAFDAGEISADEMIERVARHHLR